ncbi:hypothetical protein Ppa06_62530 [Planomonospora parontospora subsp. parontospora]|uniref:Uncharacterized protein n=2 Tax=Planomonospora parontospora TaxID=58119 RepID=A0AA37BC10_9ACTN|nr:hypothetical protein [Planomonospora parontospora]GGK49326.1 hypothetical protein GCM10010126_06170 [Planomonospora parontospora]GII12455.1 hypothetical protein Ppa06_62530 [Planomonospora parontospora subsp. parontospora]
MGRRALIDHEELRRLAGQGLSNAELAARFGVSESGILQAKRAAGLSKPMLDHSRAIPWKLNRAHTQSGPATNLRNLSSAAQGRTIPPEKLNTALRWADRLVSAGLDVAYDPELGFREVPAAAAGESLVGKVLAEARRALPDGRPGP